MSDAGRIEERFEGAPVIGEYWTDHRYVPHGQQGQVIAWLLAGLNPGRLVRVTRDRPQNGVAPGRVAYARCVNADGALGREHTLTIGEFLRSFRRVPDEPPDPRDVPRERPPQ